MSTTTSCKYAVDVPEHILNSKENVELCMCSLLDELYLFITSRMTLYLCLHIRIVHYCKEPATSDI